MAHNFISNVTLQYDYFNLQLDSPDWENKKVLDFGGNVGNILMDPNCKIKHENYWCLDVSKDAITEGQKRYPSANFRFYDDYNFSFNPYGIQNLAIPNLECTFDIILAYSIFTHMEENEIFDKIDQLLLQLKPGGQLIFTFLVADYNPYRESNDYEDLPNFQKRVAKLNNGMVDQNLVSRSFNFQKSMVLINGRHIYNDGEQQPYNPIAGNNTIFTYFKPDYLKSRYDCEILNPPLWAYYRTYPAEFQHSCIITKKS